MSTVMYRAIAENGVQVYAGRTFGAGPGDTIPADIAAAAASNAADAAVTIDHWQLEITQLESMSTDFDHTLGAGLDEPAGLAVVSGPNSTTIRIIPA